MKFPPMFKRIILVLFGLFLIAQFIQPDRSVPPTDPSTDLLVMTNAPEDIRTAVKGACYDCHSNETQYPFYAYITPFNWWLQDHIDEGREHVNYSRWDLFAGTEHAAESGEEMVEGEMPPWDYRTIHGHAQLTPAQSDAVVAWFNVVTSGAGSGGQHARLDRVKVGDDDDNDD